MTRRLVAAWFPLCAWTACGDCEQVTEPASASQAELARAEREAIPSTCAAAGETAAGDPVAGRLILDHDLDRFEARSWEGRSCDPTVQVWGLADLTFLESAGDRIRAAGATIVAHGALTLADAEASWVLDADLAEQVANPLWGEPRVVARAELPEGGGCSLDVVVAGEGEVHGIDISGQRPLFSAWSAP